MGARRVTRRLLRTTCCVICTAAPPASSTILGPRTRCILYTLYLQHHASSAGGLHSAGQAGPAGRELRLKIYPYLLPHSMPRWQVMVSSAALYIYMSGRMPGSQSSSCISGKTHRARPLDCTRRAPIGSVHRLCTVASVGCTMGVAVPARDMTHYCSQSSSLLAETNSSVKGAPQRQHEEGSPRSPAEVVLPSAHAFPQPPPKQLKLPPSS